MISCTRCGSSGHFSCLHMQNPRLIDTVKSYDWKCMECKLCEVCSLDTVRLRLFMPFKSFIDTRTGRLALLRSMR